MKNNILKPSHNVLVELPLSDIILKSGRKLINLIKYKNGKVFSDFEREQNNIIGEGTFGTVFSVSYNNIDFAIKYIKDDKVYYQDSIFITTLSKQNNNETLHVVSNDVFVNLKSNNQYLIKELIISYNLNICPNIVSFYGFLIDDGNLFIIISREITSVYDIMFKLSNNDRIILAKKVVHDIANALVCIHNLDIVHQDIKPENILVDKNGVYKISDFGLASFTCEHMDKSGTPLFMPPEVIIPTETILCKIIYNTNSNQTSKFDIWSLGITIINILTNQFLFNGKYKGCGNIQIDIPTVPFILNELLEHKKLIKDHHLINLLKGMLNNNINDRFTAKQVLNHKWCN
jgi:serine/threonine protein kinase